MPAYFVESGTVQCEIQAYDGHKAALWAVHQGLQGVLPDGVWELVPAGCGTPSELRKALPMMADSVRVAPSQSPQTPPRVYALDELVTQWKEIVEALAALDRKLDDVAQAAA